MAKSASWCRDLSVEVSSNRLANMPYDASGNLRQLMINKPVDLAYNCCENLVKTDIITRSNEADDSDYYIYDSGEQRTRKVCEALTNQGAITDIEDTIYLGNYQVKRRRTLSKNGNEVTNLDRQTLRVFDGGCCILVMHYWVQDNNKREMQTGDRSFRWQLGNEQESVSVEVDDNAQIISYEEYFPYGGTAIISGPSQQEVSLKTYRYSNKERDDTTGLYYYGQRYYANWLTRWMKPDPAGTIDGLNLYAFVAGNPIMFTDSNGLSSKKKATKGKAKKPATKKKEEVANPKKKKKSAKGDDSEGEDETLWTKKRKVEGADAVRGAIDQTHGAVLKQSHKTHSTWVYTGTTDEEVSPNKEMKPERKIVRHLSTALLSQNENMQEVQAAICHASKTIYIACNKNEEALSGLLTGAHQLEDFKIPKGTYGGRKDSHIKQLKAEIKGDYQDYKIEQVSGFAGQHAETKIVEAGKIFDFVGGTRRPCLACSLYFQIKGIAKKSYNPHPGGYWEAKAATMSLSPHVDGIPSTTYSGTNYRNKGLSKRGALDYDTDSDDR